MEVAGTATSLTLPSGLGLNIIEHQRCRLDNMTRMHACDKHVATCAVQPQLCAREPA